MTDLWLLEILLKTDFTCTNKSNRILLFGMVVVIITSIPLMMSGLWKNGTGHDMFFHLMRIEGLTQGIKSGQFPVRIQPGWYNGYGYATSVFYGDLFLWIPAALHLIGIPLQVSYKIFVFACNLATFYVAFYSFNAIFRKEWVAFFGAIWYTISLYRLINVYIRHAVGEHTAMIFFPLIGYAMVCLLRETPETTKGIKALVIGMTGILQSHMISFEITVGVLIVICLIYIKRTFRRETIVSLIKATGLTVVANLWFLIPLLEYMRNGTFNANTVSEYKKSINIGDSGLFIKQLFRIKYGAAGVNLPVSAGIENEMPLGVGMGGVIILLALIASLVLGIKGKESKETVKFNAVVLIGAVVAMFLSSIYFPWGVIEDIGNPIRYAIINIQFPWRFLGVASTFLAFGVCIISQQFKIKKLGDALIAVALLFALISGISLLEDETKVSTRVYVRDINDLNTCEPSGEEYLPYGTNVEELIAGDVRTTNLTCVSWEKEQLRFEANIENNTVDNGYILAPLLYYKGYRAEIDSGSESKILPVSYGDNKRILVEVPPQTTGKMSIQWNKPSLWWIGDIGTIVGLTLAFLVRKRNESKSK